jgi:hypothetical protein
MTAKRLADAFVRRRRTNPRPHAERISGLAHAALADERTIKREGS